MNSPNSPTEAIVYVDHLNFFTLGWIFRRRKRILKIYYFDISSMSQYILSLLYLPPIHWPPAEKLVFQMGDVQTEKGGCLHEHLLSSPELPDLYRTIVHRYFHRVPVIRWFMNRHGKDAIEMYLTKKMDRSLRPAVLSIYVSLWHAGKNGFDRDQICYLCSHYYAAALREHARARGLQSYTYIDSLRWARRIARIFVRLFWPLHTFRDLFYSGTPLGSGALSAPLLTASYSGKGVGLDPAVRSDLFWVIPSDIPRNQVMIHFERTDLRLTSATAAALDLHKMKYVAGSENARDNSRMPIVRPGMGYALYCIGMNAYLLCYILYSLVRCGAWTDSYYTDFFLDFTRYYAKWKDFINKTGTKIYIHNHEYNDDSIPLHLALKDTGGISVGFQFSDIETPYQLMGVCRDVYFSFGPYYQSFLSKTQSLISRTVFIGYITDQSIALVKENARQHRQRLRDAGAKFIVCFFDENSSDDRMAWISNRNTSHIYRQFLNAVLEDPSLGLIVKPAYPNTLFRRIPDVQPLAERAKRTGRCLFLDKGAVVTEILPTEAAQAADVAVGLLLGGTAALESFLSGTATVFLDVEKILGRPEYSWKHRIAYNTWDDLWAAINEFRSNPAGHPHFGDLSPVVDQKDPFRDGKASLRMGEYLSGMLQRLTAGETRDQAIAYADEKYLERWGKDKIVTRTQARAPQHR